MDTIKCSTINVLTQLLGLNKSFQEVDTLLSSPTFMTFLARAVIPAEHSTDINLKCNPTQLSKFDYKRSGLISELEEALDKKKPASIGFCGNLLKNGKSYKGFSESWTRKGDCLSHVSVVVGKRIKNGEIQYLIQDSLGMNFPYHSDFEKENNRLWIDQKTLLNNLQGVNYIK